MLPVFLIMIVAFTGLCEGAGILPDGLLDGSVGGTVMFTTTLTPTETPFNLILWLFGTKTIISSEPTSNQTEPDYEGRITLFPSTGSLELRNLRLNETGEYVVRIYPGNLEGRTTLNVYEPVPSATVTANNTDLVEFNDSVSLSCSSSGSQPFSYLWMNGSSEVTESDRVQLADGGATLIIVGVTRYDDGTITCRVSNPVSSAISEPANIKVSYGPDNIKLTLSPPQGCYEVGSNVNLFCSAESSPSAQFTWFLNGSKRPDTGPKLTLKKIQKSQSGNYSCQAFNHNTQRYLTSEPSSVSVIERVSNVVVKSNTTDLVEFRSSVSLSCSSSGSSLSFLWMNGSSEVTASDRVQLTDGGSILTIITVTRYDQGPYSCKVSNSFSSGISDSVNIFISYGPENTELKTSPSKECFKKGSNIRLSCSAVSRPDAMFQWFLNGSLLNDIGPQLKLRNVQMDQSGNYSCKAFNNNTQRNQTSQPSVISVYDPGWPRWLIVLIVISCIVLIAGGGATGYYFIKVKPRKTSSKMNNSTTADGGQQDNAAYGSEEVNYADVKFSKNRNGGTVALGTENPSSNYAQIKVNNTNPAASSPPTYDVHMQQAVRRAPQPDGNGAQTYAQVHKTRLH